MSVRGAVGSEDAWCSTNQRRRTSRRARRVSCEKSFSQSTMARMTILHFQKTSTILRGEACTSVDLEKREKMEKVGKTCSAPFFAECAG